MTFDIAIIGAGIAGASLAAALGPELRLLILEAEDQPGYHATGRSAAFWDECYGGPDILPLTRASGLFLADPPDDYGGETFLLPRGALYLCRESDRQESDDFFGDYAARGVQLEKLERNTLHTVVPGIRQDWSHGHFAPDCSDIDVARLHAAYLKRARLNGAEIAVRQRVTKLERSGANWIISTPGESFTAATIVNAAGAWADQIAELAGARPIGIEPRRRTMIQARVAFDVPSALPLVLDFNGGFYFKPGPGGTVWLSPQDETLSLPCDASPEELDVAQAINRLEEAVEWTVARIEHRWAGLRSFAPDRLPVYGYDAQCPGFFWCAGQGGFGIQTSPAAASLCAALLKNEPNPEFLQDVEPELYAPDRFLAGAT